MRVTKSIKDFCKRVLPSEFLRLVYRYIWNPVRNFYWRLLDLDCELRSGLHVRIRNRPDWEMYNEVLVNGEYDIPLEHAINAAESNRQFVVVDLGANVGYFACQCANECIIRGMGGYLSLIVVEAAPLMFQELQRRIESQALLRDKVRLLHGLVGRKSGQAYITGSHLHYSNVACEKPRPGSSRVEYLNLDQELARFSTIDLIKCDIEGSEFDFIDNYEELLRKTRAAVFEFHRYGRNLDHARNKLAHYGFSSRKVLRDSEHYSIEFFSRES